MIFAAQGILSSEHVTFSKIAPPQQTSPRYKLHTVEHYGKMLPCELVFLLQNRSVHSDRQSEMFFIYVTNFIIAIFVQIASKQNKPRFTTRSTARRTARSMSSERKSEKIRKVVTKRLFELREQANIWWKKH